MEIDMTEILKLMKSDPEIRKARYNVNQSQARKLKKEQFLKDNPEVALEMERKRSEKIKLKDAREYKKPKDENKAKEREQYLQQVKEETESNRRKRISEYIDNAGVDEKMYEFVKNVQIFEREEYCIATITLMSGKYYKEEKPTKQDCEDWISSKLRELEEELIEPEF